MPEDELSRTADDGSASHSRASLRDIAMICVGAIMVFSIGLPHEFIGLDTRYALFAKEMLRDGLSFFPTAFSLPYPDYPATTIFPVVWLSKVNGDVTPFTAILPTSIVSTGILVFTYLIGCLRSRTWGRSAVCMGLLTLAFLRAARSVSPDQWISLATVIAFFVVYSARKQRRHRRLWFVPVLLVLGFLARGPIGLIIPTCVVLTLCLCLRQFKAATLWTLAAMAILAIGCWALLVAAEYQGGEEFARRVWKMQVSGRLAGGGRGPTYYWLTALGSYAFVYPITLAVGVSLLRRKVRLDRADAHLLFSLAMCTAVLLAGMSIPAEKKTRYVLSIVPFLALLAAYGMVLPRSQVVLGRLLKTVTLHSATLPWIAGLACAVRALLAAFDTIPGEVYALRACICVALSSAIAVYVCVRSSRAKVKSVHVLAVCAASLIVFHVGVIEPSMWAKEESQTFARHVEKRCMSSGEPIVFFQLGPDQEDIVLAANMPEPFQPRFISSLADLRHASHSSCIIAAEESLPEIATAIPLQERVLQSGTLGGERVVLCSKKGILH